MACPLFFLFLFSWSNLSCRRLDVYHTSTHVVANYSANLRCRSETCTLLAENAGRKKIAKNLPSGHHRTTLSGYNLRN